MNTPAAGRPIAYVVHSMPGRARLRFPDQQGSAPFFEGLVAALEKNAGVLQVRASANTGSVLLLHTGDLPSLLGFAQKKGLFDVAAPPPPAAAMRRLVNAIDSFDDRVAKGTGDALSVGKLLFVGLVAGGFYQANRGHFLPAGLTLLKHALELMHWVADREPTNSPDRA